MKKQILIVFTGTMDLGGIERSLLGLLESFDYKKYDVDLFLYGHHGELFHLIDQRVHLLPECKELAYTKESMGAKIRNRCYYSAILRIVDEFKAKFQEVNYDETRARIIRKKVPLLTKEYDLAIGFFRPFDLLTEKVNAKVKIGWVHTDYSKAGSSREELYLDYQRVDYIAAVSKHSAKAFKKLLPELSTKVLTIENILSDRFIWEEAEKVDTSEEMLNDGGTKLLSVGRFCDAKNFDSIPEICSLMTEQRVDKFRWYIIGFGTDEQLVREKIREYNMEDKVIILGKKENPYPYIKACDIYVQPSRYEGKSVAVIEAQILNKPVVITNYPTAKSQLEDGVDGVIVPMDNEGCAKGIANVIQDAGLREKLISNTKVRDYTNKKELNKLYRLI